MLDTFLALLEGIGQQRFGETDPYENCVGR